MKIREIIGRILATVLLIYVSGYIVMLLVKEEQNYERDKKEQRIHDTFMYVQKKSKNDTIN